MERMLLGAMVLLLAAPAGAQERSEKDSTDSPRAVSGLVGGLGSFFGARRAASLNTSALPNGWGCSGRCIGLGRKLVAPPFDGTASSQLSSSDQLDAGHGVSRSTAMRDDSWNRGDDSRTSSLSLPNSDARASDVTQPDGSDATNSPAAVGKQASSFEAPSYSNANDHDQDDRAPWQSTDYLTSAAGAPVGEAPRWTAVYEPGVSGSADAGFASLAAVSDLAVTPAAAVVTPEPSSVALVTAGLVALFAHRRRRSRS